MALKTVVASLSDVAEAFRSEYESKDGKFVLKLDGDPHGYVKESEVSTLKNQVAEFRENNRALNATKTELESKLKPFEGLDVEAAKAAIAKVAELEKKGVKGGDDVAALVQQAVASAVGPLSAELKAIKESEQKAQAALARKSLEGTLQAAGIKAGVVEQALADYQRRGLEVFQMDGDKVVAKKPDGTPLFRNGNPLTVDDWAADLQAEAPHLFKPSKGGGSGPGPGGPGNGSGVVRAIPAGARLTDQDLKDLAAGTAVREQAVAS